MGVVVVVGQGMYLASNRAQIMGGSGWPQPTVEQCVRVCVHMLCVCGGGYASGATETRGGAGGCPENRVGKGGWLHWQRVGPQAVCDCVCVCVWGGGG